jgi:hypothetical protein
MFENLKFPQIITGTDLEAFNASSNVEKFSNNGDSPLVEARAIFFSKFLGSFE